jgi:hypothetical protein
LVNHIFSSLPGCQSFVGFGFLLVWGQLGDAKKGFGSAVLLAAIV